MLPEKVLNLHGVTYTLTKIHADAQVECECILARLLGPSIALAGGVLVDTFMGEAVEFFRGVAEDGDQFDLANLIELAESLDTKDPRIAAAWAKLLDAATRLGGQMLADVVPAATDRLDHAAVARLFEIALLGNLTAERPGGLGPARVKDLRVLSDLTDRRPLAKWSLLAASLRFTYGAGTDSSGADDEAGAGA